MFDAFLQPESLAPLLVPFEERGMFPRAADRARWEKLPAATLSVLSEWGKEAIQGYPTLTASGFMAYRRAGDRQAWEKPYFCRRKRLIGAALALCAFPLEKAFQDAVIDGLWLTLEETTWAVSAHYQGKDPLPMPDDPLIDLFSAQTAATVAQVCYLLEDTLDTACPGLVKRARNEIGRRVLTPFIEDNGYWWMGFREEKLNNWTPWILSNVIDAFLMTEKDRAVLAPGLSRTLGMLGRYLNSLPRDGGLDEGIGYWNMAGGSLLDCLESLDHATGGAINVYSEPIVRALGAFPPAMHVQDEYFLNFADCDARPYVNWQRVWRFGVLTDCAEARALGAERFSFKEDIYPKDTPQMNRALQALFFPPLPSEKPAAPAFTFLPHLQVFSWRRGSLYAAVKGGHNNESHNHNDVGSIIVYEKGEPVIADAGNVVYTGQSFGPKRYEQWHTRAKYHSIPLINGAEQQAGREYAAKNVRADETGASMDLEDAYPASSGVARFTRDIRVSASGVFLTDDIALLMPGTVEWCFLSRREPRFEGSRVLLGSMELRFPAGLTPAAERIDITDPRMARSFPGCLWRLSFSGGRAPRHQAVFELIPLNQ